MDDFDIDELLNNEPEPAKSSQTKKTSGGRPQSAQEEKKQENDDLFSHGIKSRLDEADNLISQASKGASFSPPQPKKVGKVPPKSAQGNLEESEGKEKELEAILNSIEKHEVFFKKR